MDGAIASILVLDGVTNGAIYALLALALVLVFAVTRVIFIPQGEFVAFGALTLAGLQLGHTPLTIHFLIGMALLVAVLDLIAAVRSGRIAAAWGGIALRALPGVAIGLCGLWLAPMKLPLVAQALLTLAIVTPMGGLLYRLAYQSLADASVLVLLIASVALHFALTGLALVFFGAEGFRTPAFSDTGLTLGTVNFSGQSLWIYAVTLLLIVAMGLFFAFTLRGKALRATAFNRTGARLVGFSPTSAGLMTFTFAAFLGTLSGVLIAPIITVYYDSGFLIGLKGFVAAIVGGLASYPMTALGAVLVGVLEAFSSFWASGYKEVIVFTLIIPVLIWLSITAVHHEEEEH